MKNDLPMFVVVRSCLLLKVITSIGLELYMNIFDDFSYEKINKICWGSIGVTMLLSTQDQAQVQTLATCRNILCSLLRMMHT